MTSPAQPPTKTYGGGTGGLAVALARRRLGVSGLEPALRLQEIAVFAAQLALMDSVNHM